MRSFSRAAAVAVVTLLLLPASALRPATPRVLPVSASRQHVSRAHVARALAAVLVTPVSTAAFAAKDCFQDCSQNCDRVAPRSGRYCEQTCGDYCAQDDRQDGLSGSVDSSKGEVGLLSAYDLVSKVTGGPPATVPYGQDRPPAIGGKLGEAISGSLQQAVRPGSR